MKLSKLWVILLVLNSGILHAQVETFQDETGRISGFGGPFVGISQLVDEVAIVNGAGGGVLVGGFFLGGCYEQVLSSSPFYFGNYTTSVRTGALWTGYSILTRKKVHPYVSLKAGWGGVSIRDNNDFDTVYSDSVLSLHPEAGVELNLTRVVRLVVSGGYRQVMQVDGLPFGLEQEDFSSFSGLVTLRLGGFAPKPAK